DLADLSQPAILDDLRQVPSVALFLERASGAADSGADAADLKLLVDGRLVADICIRLDGLPLAIELAAAQARRMGTPQLHARLTQPTFLGALNAGPRDLADHQRAMRSTIAWSYNMLAEPEQRLFRWLGVFIGGASPDALATVCELSEDALEASLAALVDASLLQRSEHAGAPRYTQLVTLRAYAQERLLAEGEWEAARQRHAAYCLALVEALDPDDAAQYEQVVARVELEYENVRAALAWALATGARLHALRMAAALWFFWISHPYYLEGLDWLERCVALATEAAAPVEAAARWQEQETLAKALRGVMAISDRLDHTERANEAGEQALALRRALGDPVEIAAALNDLANVAVTLRDFDRAIALYQECLALCRATNNRFGMILPLMNLGACYHEMNRPQEALTLAEESLALSYEKGEIDWARALTWATIGDMCVALDDTERAIAVTEPSYRLFAHKRDTFGVAVCALTLGRAEWRQGALEQAHAHLDEAARLFDALGNLGWLARTRYVRASVALEHGDLAAARRDLMAALDNLAGPAHGKDRAWWIIERAATLIALCGAPEIAARLLGAAIAQRAATPAPFEPAERTLRARELERLRVALGADACEERLAAGHALTLEAAIALARRELQRDMPMPIAIWGA
ncbi:MAG TPA: tetratricopeptide repeat protein, partial [Ktedonobacterales bacterium]|nr:tetratricopeptide repeat protein [Ktedonobacterales bacterium]